MENFYYRRLDVYQNAKVLSHEVCKLIKAFPVDERFGLCDQLRRAAMSIPINIAEGFGRFSAKEKAHFIQIAFGSINEVMCELEVCAPKRRPHRTQSLILLPKETNPNL